MQANRGIAEGYTTAVPNAARAGALFLGGGRDNLAVAKHPSTASIGGLIMIRRRFPVALLGVLACSGFLLATGPADEPKPDKDGFVSLFNGKDIGRLEVGTNPESWSVRTASLSFTARAVAPVLRRADS